MPWPLVVRRIVQSALLGLMIAAAALTVVHLRARPKVTATEAKPAEKIAGPSKPIGEIQLVQTQPQPEVEATPVNPGDAADLATLTDAAVAELHEGVTLEQWTKAQAKIEDWQPSKEEAFFDCRTLVKTEVLSSGRRVKHFVYFYPPQAPTPAIFPAGSGDDLLNRDCLLSMVRVETAAFTDRDGHDFEQALQEQFVKKYGDSIGMKETVFGGAAAWHDAARWIPGSEIVSAYDPQPRQNADDPDDAGTPNVFVLARLPIVYGIEQDSCCRIRDHYHSIEQTQFHQALAIAAADSGLTQRVATLFTYLFRRIALGKEASPGLDKSRASVLPVLREWLKAVASLPPVRHAAGLYVADRLLVAASDDGWPDLIAKEKTELRSAFETIGASFTYDELGGCYNYSQNWLNQARELDPDGRVSQMAVLLALARGGAPKLAKDKLEELDIFHTVISDGEWLLAKKPDPPTAAQIHFIIGDAYADIVALAGGGEPDYGDPKKYEPEAPSAHEKALGHYRAGLAIDGASENAKYAWMQAWKISAGLLPTTRYVHIYD